MVPHPPLLVPELVPGRVDSTGPVREATLAAVARLAQVSRDWVAVAAGEGGHRFGPESAGSFRGYGVDVPVTLSAGHGAGAPADLPLPVLVAGWLRARAGADSVRVEPVAPAASPAECAELGAELARRDTETGLLVLGDGANCHGPRAPGFQDGRAADFDAKVASALAGADAETLLALDPDLAAELGAAGRAPWQVLAGLARRWPGWRGELLYSAAPFGVAYHVAVWERR
ncbi:hypothetical protein B0I33_10714 [Prauserella shujinwangii]|uniref:Catalytic LigB subunit of aromatic ring-opening dioxygenase n=1 Tax=Prauserella shujinwangii TaxID=1453103 RepID=A0A2T0LRY9_9PSEU|nr:hypothetical protein B0I33_10714 [Prauserella shujinwangii]